VLSLLSQANLRLALLALTFLPLALFTLFIGIPMLLPFTSCEAWISWSCSWRDLLQDVASRWSEGSRAEMSTDQDWIGLDQDWRQFWQDQDWIGLQLFFNWRIRTGSDWANLCCFNVIILNISKLLVVIRFHRIANWSCIYKTSNRLVVYILPSISKALLGILWNSNCIHRYPHITLILVAT